MPSRKAPPLSGEINVRFVLSEGIDNVVSRQVSSGPETRAALNQFMAETGVAGGGGGSIAQLPTGILQTHAPHTDGTWPTLERAAGARVWWLRALDANTKAPIPTAANGYVAGDMIDPPADRTKGEFMPFTGVVFSDSFSNTTSGELSIKGRTADNYAGGNPDMSVLWDYGPASDAVSYVKALVDPADYTNIAASGYIWPTSPIPVDVRRRISFDLRALNNNHGGIIGIRGDNLGANQVGVTFGCSPEGVVTWRIRSRYPATNFGEVTLGSLTPADWARVVITQDGPSITVKHGDTTFTGAIPAAGMAYKPLFGIGATQYGTVHLRNLVYEAL